MGEETGERGLVPELTTEEKLAVLDDARWFTPDDPPTECGLYYWEHGDQHGNPHPGMYLWEEGKPPNFPYNAPWKMFGPIRGAMQPWEPLVKEEG